MDQSQQDTQGGWRPHPAVQISIWTCLALLSQTLHGLALMASGAAMLSLALGIGATRLFILLRRTRWILIALLLVYAFTTPGEPWFAQLGALSPSHEGVEDGLMQLLRLVTVLAGLAILLTQLATAQLISGLYSLAYPLHCLGVPRERIVVRLALTLRYAENAMLDNARDGMRSLDNLMAPVQAAPENIELKLLPLSGRDWLLLFTGCALVLGVLL